MESRMNATCIIAAAALCVSFTADAQRSLVRKGNELYGQKKYAEAGAAYQKALEKQPQSVPGAFNLGNALIQQKKYDAARQAMTRTAKTAKDPNVKSGAEYNIGNTYMSEQQWQQAIEAYKEALRKNPVDADAQYNLSYALAKLKQQQQQQDKKKNEDKQDQKDKEKKDKDKKDPQDGDQKGEKRPQKQPGSLTEQQADNLLKALQQDERKVQDKMQQSKASPVKMEKDW
jgi:tetratricopeptide (TPR) repeat protein